MGEIFDFELALSQPTEMGWRSVNPQPAKGHLGGKLVSSGVPVLTLVHLSDTHLCDADSPVRLPFTDRFGDPHHELSDRLIGPIGNYRPNERLTGQVLEMMVRTVNRLSGPVGAKEPDVVVFTGDLTDNAQLNEFELFHSILMSDSTVSPSSDQNGLGPGGLRYDPHYWNPDGTPGGEPDDYPRAKYGFPIVPQLHLASALGWKSEGLRFSSIAVHGNHDALLQGTVTADAELRALAVGSEIPVSLVRDESVLDLVKQFAPHGPAGWPSRDDLKLTRATPVASRGIVSNGYWESAFGRKKYSHCFVNDFVLISLDTVNPFGGWDGSLDEEQFAWLSNVLSTNKFKPIILLSHHPVTRLRNLYSPEGSPARVSGAQVLSLLSQFGNILMWLAGHEHRNKIERIGGAKGFWAIETCSLIDWPQEGRVLEIFCDEDGEFEVVSTMFHHASTISAVDPRTKREAVADIGLLENLAGLSRELGANHWQRRSGRSSVSELFGSATSRNFVFRQELRFR